MLSPARSTTLVIGGVVAMVAALGAGCLLVPRGVSQLIDECRLVEWLGPPLCLVGVIMASAAI